MVMSARILVGLGLWCVVYHAASTAQGEPLPSVPPGWKLEVVVAAPRVRHPSVVCCAPDGRVFVAEDPMDISTPRADLPQGRILCINPDGRITVFAEGLHAVFGMQFIDGRLFVLHNPKFSVFAAGAPGPRCTDLIECTNPNPWALDWNDHVPANFRLGMDGFLYVAVGDKGVYGAIGRDGKRVDLRGGGILRLRPDGTALEVYCTGVRNILDVALDAEDEIFTYDNTDEHNWMSRLTHMVDGGFYGYPYDFVPRRPYTLWMMADYGAGAATGTLCYTEDALPEEYHGNLFLADFGKRQVLRVAVKRDGATFGVVFRTDLFGDPPTEFRPVGLGLAPDGLGLYICDWQHRDTKERVSVGRLLKLTYTGASCATPKPIWYVPAALGRPVRATVQDLLAGLAHPARSVRDVAQRQLAARGKSAIATLLTLLKDGKAQVLARQHALWALDAIDGGLSARSAIIQVAAHNHPPGLRRQAIRQLGARRAVASVAVLRNLLKDADAGVRFQASTALGRIADASVAPALIEALDERDSVAGYAVFTALNRIGRTDPAAWPAIVGGLAHPKTVARSGVRMALRETESKPLLSALAAFAHDSTRPAAARADALALLAAVAHRLPAWRGQWWAYHPALHSPPEKTESWAGTPTILAALRDHVDDHDPRIRRASVEGLKDAGDATSTPRLRRQFRGETDQGVRRALLVALGSFRDTASRGLIVAVLRDPKEEAAIKAEAVAAGERVGGDDVAAAIAAYLDSSHADPPAKRAAIAALGRLKWTAAVPRLESLARDHDLETRQTAFDALAALHNDAGRDAILHLSASSAPDVRRAAVAVLVQFGPGVALPRLLEAYRDPETRAAALTALTQMPDLRALDAYLAGLGGADATARDACRNAIGRIRNEALPRIESRADRLPPIIVTQLRQIYHDHSAAAKGPLFTVAAQTPSPETYQDFALRHAGSPARGRELFHDRDRLGCIKCHRVGGSGGDVGPDLSNVGTQFDRSKLAESVLFPSRSIREGYQQMTAATADGRLFSGLVRAESAETLTLRDAEGKDHAVPTGEIQDRAISALSLMPDGSHLGLPLQSFADLIAYLESLKASPDSEPRKRRQ
jgi:putative heme-binding domain-containing protein